MSETEGLAKRLEAIEIKLTGELEAHYDIYQAKNGEQAGTAGYAYRLEGIIIKLVPKGQEFQLKTKRPLPFYDANE